MTQLIAKLAKASQLVGGKLKADKFNQEQRYGYISADKILAECGQALADSGVMVIPELADITVDATPYTSARGNALTRYDARVNFIMHICDEETSIKFMWVGLGSDFTAQDKAVYKAITSGHRYFLAKLLTVGEGNEDGEHEGDATTGTETTGTPKVTGTAEHKPAAQASASTSAVPTCPKCDGPMWDNRKKVAEGSKGPEWSCKAGKWNAETKQTDGCDGKLWKGEWPPREKPSEPLIATIIAASQDLYGKATGATMKAWLEKDFQIVNPKSLKDGLEHLTPDQAAGMYASLVAEQDKRRAEMDASSAEVAAWGTDAEK